MATNQVEPFIPTDELEPQVLSLRVTNMNPFTLRDRFDGTLFEFHQNAPKDVPVDAARHIFGWYPSFTDQSGEVHSVDPVAMRMHCQKRFGWNTPAMMENGGADLFFENIMFRPIMYRMVPVAVDEEGEPLVEQTKRSPKVNKVMAAADSSREK